MPNLDTFIKGLDLSNGSNPTQINDAIVTWNSKVVNLIISLNGSCTNGLSLTDTGTGDQAGFSWKFLMSTNHPDSLQSELKDASDTVSATDQKQQAQMQALQTLLNAWISYEATAKTDYSQMINKIFQ